MNKTVVEYCSHCETEVEMKWDIERDGYKAFCPYCGNRLMLCDECQHRTGGACTEDCDYDTETDTCRFNKREAPKVRSYMDIDTWANGYRVRVGLQTDLPGPRDHEVRRRHWQNQQPDGDDRGPQGA